MRCTDAGVSPNSLSIRRDATQAHCSTISDPRYDNVADKSAYLGRQGRLDSRKIRHLPLRRKMGGRSCTLPPRNVPKDHWRKPVIRGSHWIPQPISTKSGPHCLSLLTHTASSCLSISRFFLLTPESLPRRILREILDPWRRLRESTSGSGLICR